MNAIILIAIGAAVIYFFRLGSGRARGGWLRSGFDQLVKKGTAASEAGAHALDEQEGRLAEREQALRARKTDLARREAELKAAAEKAKADQLAADKAAADKAAADKAAADKLAAEKAAANKAAAEKAAADKLAAEREQALRARESDLARREAELKAAAEKAKADQLTAEKVAKEKAAAQKTVFADKAKMVLEKNFQYNDPGNWRVEKHPRFLADLTGDGRADIVGFGNEGVWIAITHGSSSSYF